MPLFSAVTFNASIADIRLFGRALYCPVPWPGERLRQLPRALFDLDADLVCLQGVQGAGRQAWLRRALHKNYPYVAGLASRLALRPGSTQLVLSRFPLSGARVHRLASDGERFASCGFLEVEVRVPAIGTFTVISFQASAGRSEGSDGQAAQCERERQIGEILECAGTRNRVLLAGDLDAGPDASPACYRRILDAGFVDVYGAAERPGVTWDPANPLVAAGRRAHLPPRRIDHIFLSTALAQRLGEARAGIVLAERRVDSPRGRVPLSDHYGVHAQFRARAERGA